MTFLYLQALQVIPSLLAVLVNPTCKGIKDVLSHFFSFYVNF